ncbi:VOC family protein [Novosphingobium sp. Gsoil 351]|uniref:VOC family protein n=1 Tax=Novosphingobium sp. Gsoil 351 TaxID=2675225 RepID=UPI0012B48680|nr:VOC family protein [Novosphingobium sp. Gsoil 351]QGN53275.1 VOC family protein [Novosphingobium sp. Gsoil 351]
MAKPTGGFIWYELMTTDLDAAARFYGAVIGWNISATSASEGQDYRMIGRSDGGAAGGVLKLSKDMIDHGARPVWLGYLHVADVDAAVAAIEADGGKVQMAAMDIPQGRIAMIADPQGAPIYLMKPIPPADQPDAESDVFSVDQPQRVRWNELQSSDAEASVAFYKSHFGWTQEGEMDMGPMGKYRFVQHDGVGIGAVMPKMEAVPHSVWSFYIGVGDIDRAVAAVTAGGGTLDGAVMEIPGGEFSVHCSDPQGAAFGLVGPRKG